MYAHIPVSLAQTLIRTFIENKQQIARLNALLEEERQCLGSRDSELLLSILQQKEPLLETITESEKMLERLLRKAWQCCATKNHHRHGQHAAEKPLGLFDSTVVSHVIDECPPQLQKPFTVAWKQFRNTVDQTRSLIAINEQVVHHAKKTVNNVLALMRGQDSAATLYQANGHRSQQAKARFLAHA